MFSSSKPQRTYTAEERVAALSLTEKIGLSAAGRELGIPIQTISTWKRKALLSASIPLEARVATSGGSVAATKAKRPTVAGSTTKRKTRSSAGNQEAPVDATGAVTVTKRSKVAGATKKGGALSGADRPQVPVSTSEGSAVPTVTTPSTSGATTTGVDRQQPPKRRIATYTPSERARILEFAAQESVTAASVKFGASRFSIYDWQRQVRLHAAGEATTSPVVGSDEDPVAARDMRILSEWKAHPGLGPSQVRNQLRRQGFKVSVHTVRCVLEEHGYVTPKIRRQEAHDQRYEAVRPNHLWHLDFLHRYVHKHKVYVLLLLDDYSRFIVGGAIWDGERVAAVQETFMSAVARHGRPEKAMSDGGSAFYSWRGIGAFTSLLEELETDQHIATIPQVNGKLEVLNANIQKELFEKEKFFDLGEAQRRLEAWIHFYNFGRTHHALGGLLVPADRYYGRAEEVLAQIEAGHGADRVNEPLPVHDRLLDLFRITSHRGRIEVYLLGQRLELPFREA